MSPFQAQLLCENEKEEFFGQAMSRVEKCVEDVINRSEFFQTAQKLQEQLQSGNYGKPKAPKRGKDTGKLVNRIPIAVDSEITIYKNVVKDGRGMQRESSSSEEWIDTSDEMLDRMEVEDELVPSGENDLDTDEQITDFITESRRQSQEMRKVGDDAQPSTSGWQPNPQPRDNSQQHNQANAAQTKARDLVREAEAKKVDLYRPTGRLSNCEEIDVSCNFVHSVMVDENYLVVAAHVDETTQAKIELGQYVDFARLIPHDRVMEEEDNAMQMVVKQGKTYWKPAVCSECPTINNIGKWEQAFRVYSDIYTRAHPTRASELIQYNHVIHTTAVTYTWENVYLYDKDFRLHMSKYPTRHWGVILQQAWNLRLRDKLKVDKFGGNADNRSNAGSSKGFNPQDFCKRFNRGHCSFGQSCRFEHRCFYCGKFGHGVINCRQLRSDKADLERNYDRRDRHDRGDRGGHRYERHDKFNNYRQDRSDKQQKSSHKPKFTNGKANGDN